MDELDLSIIRELKLDVRQSSRKLATKLGVSGKVISRRLRRMTDANILSFCCVSNPALLGFQSRMSFGLKVRPGKEDEVVEALLQYGCVQNVNRYAGRYDLLVYAIFPDQRRQLRWMTEELGRIEHVQGYGELYVLQILKHSWGYMDDETSLSARVERLELEEAELKLIRELEVNPTEDVNSLARKVGLTRQTTAKKLQKLLSEDIVRIFCIVDPTAMGFSVHVSILLKVQLDKLSSAAGALAAKEKTTHVMILGGEYNLLFAASFRELGEMARFLRSELGELPGVIDREILVHVGRARRQFRLLEALDYK